MKDHSYHIILIVFFSCFMLSSAQLWAMKHYPQELEFLMPDGGIDPEIERARLWKKLLTEWRAETGLPPVDTGSG